MRHLTLRGFQETEKSMTLPALLALLTVVSMAGFFAGRARAIAAAGGDARRLHSLPNFHGWSAALSLFMPALAAMALWRYFAPESEVSAAKLVSVLGLGIAGALAMVLTTGQDTRARNRIEALLKAVLILCSLIAIATTLGIVLSMLFQTTSGK